MTDEEYDKLLKETQNDANNMSEDELRGHFVAAVVNWHEMIRVHNEIENDYNKYKQSSGIRIKVLEKDLKVAREIAEQNTEELHELLKAERPWATFDPLPWRDNESQD